MNKKYRVPQVAIRMVKMPPLISKEPMNTSQAAIRIMNDTLKEFDREALVVVNLKNDLKPINVNFVSMGTLNASLAHPREILKSSILSNAACIMLFHNHPSGDLSPSSDDVAVTDQLQRILIDRVLVIETFLCFQGMFYALPYVFIGQRFKPKQVAS